MKGIFVSYRREDSRLTCDRIYDTLAAVYGSRYLFRDVDAIPGGVDFRTTIEQALSQSQVFLLVIGPRWLSVTDAHGRRRLDAPNDFVRTEVESALRRQLPIIPLLVQGADLPSIQDLPLSLEPLAYQNARQVRPDPDFHRDMQLVLRDLAHHFAPVVKTSPWRRVRSGVQHGVRWGLTVLSLALTLLGLATWISIPYVSELVRHLLSGR